MLYQPQQLVRGSDVVLLAAAIHDDTMRKSLVDRYLGPLGERRDAGTLRETLRTYFSLDCNAASAAAALGVNRHTVQRRLQKVEKTIGRSLDTCRAEMDVALRVEQLDLSH
jgi:DNA-binding PucR family transcriptional regulator